MYKVIALDLDGTLLSSDNKITKYTQKIIKIVMQQKIYFILASGRHYLDIIKIRDILNIQSFIISLNGAQIYDMHNKLIFSHNLDASVALELCKLAYIESDIITQIYQNNQWYINNTNTNNRWLPERSLLKYQYFHPDYLTYKKISKIFFTSKNFQKLHMLQKKIIQSFNAKVCISFSDPSCLEVTSKKSSKGSGLKLISNILQISLDDFIAFGDGMNDEDMLTAVGKAYIMKNADANLKTACPDIKIIDSNDRNGVAKCLYDIFIKQNE